MSKKVKDNLTYIVGVVSILTIVVGYSFSQGAARQRIASCEEKIETFNNTVLEIRTDIKEVRDDANSTNKAVYKILGKLEAKQF